MKYYKWNGTDLSGKKTTGVLAAQSLLYAKIILGNNKILINKVSKDHLWMIRSLRQKITRNPFENFSKQMATLITAGLSLTQALNILLQEQSPQQLMLLQDMQNALESGNTLASFLRKYPVYFNELICNLIEVGEKSGTLEIMLHTVAQYQDKTNAIKKNIKKALIYPCIVALIGLIVITILLLIVLPQFAAQLTLLGSDVPAFTNYIMNVAWIIKSYWFCNLIALMCISAVFIYAKSKFPKINYLLDKNILKLPWIGTIIRQIIITRFAQTLAVVITAGLPLIEALKLTAKITKNSIYATAFAKTLQEVSTGLPLRTALRNNNLFPNMVVQMIAIGEESGNLATMLYQIATHYAAEVDVAINTLSGLLEPLIMTLLGLFIGIIVVALYLPIFKLGTAI